MRTAKDREPVLEPEATSGRAPPSAERRVGYGAAIIVNAILLFVARNLLDWDVLPFLTDEYNRVLPAITLTLVVTIAVNVLRLGYSPRWFVIVTDAVATIFGLYASVRMFQVFPFDFSSYDLRWDLLVRALLIIAIGGSLIALLVAPLKLLSSGEDS